jgi:hypothetical protein
MNEPMLRYSELQRRKMGGDPLAGIRGRNEPAEAVSFVSFGVLPTMAGVAPPYAARTASASALPAFPTITNPFTR